MTSDDPLPDPRVRTACLVILAMIATGAALAALRPVLVPLLALLFTYCLRPIVETQVHWLRVPWPVAVGGAGLVGLALLAFIGLILAEFVSDVGENLPAYQARVAELLREVSGVVSLEALGLRADPDGALQ